MRLSMSVTVAWYRLACSEVRLQKTFISCLSGRSEMIVLSVFRRRSTNGWVSRLSAWVASGEPCRSIGTAYRSRNLSAGPSRPGLVKSMIDHSSDSRFSTGVPVSAILAAAGSARTARACLVAWFLMFCASSQTTRAQFTWPSAAWSLVATP